MPRPFASLPPRLLHAALFAGIVFLFLAIAAPLVFDGRVVADEGWYLLAARDIARGRLPYRDYLFTQPPGMLLLHAPVVRLLGASLEVGRAFTLLLGVLGLALTMLACGRRGGVAAATLGGLLLATNGSFAMDMTSMRTQGPTVALTAGAVFALASRSRFRSRAAAVACLTAAVAVRLSMLPALGCAWVFVFVEDRAAWRRALALVVASVAALLTTYVAFERDGQLFYGIYTFHRSLHGGALSKEVVWRFVTSVAAHQSLILAAVTLAAGRLVATWSALRLEDRRFVGLMAACWGTTTLIHGLQPVSYPTYQTSNIAFAVAFAAPVLGPLLGGWPAAAGRVAALGLVAALAFPFEGYDLTANAHGSPRQVAAVAAALRAMAPGGSILTGNTELAVAADLSLLPGLELGQFSYQRDASDAVAARRHVMTRRALVRAVAEQRADVLCLTPYFVGYWVGADGEAFQALVSQNYQLRFVESNYGQFDEPLYVLSARRLSGPEEAAGAARGGVSGESPPPDPARPAPGSARGSPAAR